MICLSSKDTHTHTIAYRMRKFLTHFGYNLIFKVYNNTKIYHLLCICMGNQVIFSLDFISSSVIIILAFLSLNSMPACLPTPPSQFFFHFNTRMNKPNTSSRHTQRSIKCFVYEFHKFQI